MKAEDNNKKMAENIFEEQSLRVNLCSQTPDFRDEIPSLAAWEGKSNYQYTSSHLTGKISHLWKLSRLRTRNPSTLQAESSESWEAAERL